MKLYQGRHPHQSGVPTAGSLLAKKNDSKYLRYLAELVFSCRRSSRYSKECEHTTAYTPSGNAGPPAQCLVTGLGRTGTHFTASLLNKVSSKVSTGLIGIKHLLKDVAMASEHSAKYACHVWTAFPPMLRCHLHTISLLFLPSQRHAVRRGGKSTTMTRKTSARAQVKQRSECVLYSHSYMCTDDGMPLVNIATTARDAHHPTRDNLAFPSPFFCPASSRPFPPHGTIIPRAHAHLHHTRNTRR